MNLKLRDKTPERALQIRNLETQNPRKEHKTEIAKYLLHYRNKQSEILALSFHFMFLSSMF